ncbi:MAG: sigma-70 family RNA polymerase sigma factor [Isosphaeraceae bacterium]|nr:sigma-70 family RNA polymerase sigma factor [Isosphaeraceae bacterium]
MDENQGLEDLSGLLSRAQAGDEEAIRSLRGLEREIRLMVRVRLPAELRSQFDSMDFVQDVWQSFLRKLREDPAWFHDVHNLRTYLKGTAKNKIKEEHRRQTKTHKYNLGRKEPLYVRQGDREVPRELPSLAPSPAENAQTQDQIARLFEGRDPLAAQILDLRQAGLTFEQIGLRVNLHERTVRRIFDSIRRELG